LGIRCSEWRRRSNTTNGPCSYARDLARMRQIAAAASSGVFGGSMNQVVWIVLVASLSLPVWGQQKTRDRNLVATRKHSDTTTVLPSRTATNQSGHEDVNSQLDKLERQTANTVIQPAAKAAQAPAYKPPPEKQTPTGTAYQQTMPVHAGNKNGVGNASHSSRSSSVKPYKR
jgi:hypothetical protein